VTFPVKKALFYITLFLCFSFRVFSSHIVGGEIFYDRINDSTYKVTLKVFRDCANGLSPFDGINGGGSCLLYVFTANNAMFGTFDIGAPVVTNIPPTINSPCITPPGGICVEQGIYIDTLILPPQPGGYYIVYQRCCRNASIANLVSPGNQGGTYYTFVPGPELVASNSSPRYDNFPPIFICNNVTFTFDHKATDPDGDQLVYSLCSSYEGGVPGPVIPPGPPPYQNVNYLAPYNGAYPIPSNPAFSINPVTGVLKGRPNFLGQYVVSVCVQEFRNGTLIQTHFRDFQFNVVSCVVQAVSAYADQKSQCEGSTITFTNQSFGNVPLSYFWNFGVPSILSDTSHAVSPTYTYQDTGRYQVTLIVNPGSPCSDTLIDSIYVYPQLNINFPPVSRQCFKGNAFTFSAQGSYVPSANFQWSFGSAATPSVSTIKNPSGVSYNQPGKYFVSLIVKQFTCIDTFIDSVRILKPPIAKINNLPVSLCDPAKVAFSNGSSSDLPLTYQWTFSNENTSTAFQPVQVFSPAGVYSATLVVTTSGVCNDTSMTSVKNITVNPSPKAGFTFTPEITTIFDPEITFMNKASFDVSGWEYTYGDGTGSPFPSDIHIYQEPGEYPVTQVVTNPFGCRDTLSKLVKVLPEFRFWIPNTFTPDDNQLNDVFMPSTIGIINYEFDIYTRWGERIYSTQNTKEGWNGFYRGLECQEGVYAWRCSFKNEVTEKDEVHYGHVLLLKNK
jgi:gliding motility-associated-like protein